MTIHPVSKTGVNCYIILFLLLMPAAIHAQPEKCGPVSPPVAQHLVREGDFAVRLLSSLGLGKTEDESDAESRLGKSGIVPRNGWIADYPVTPDIIGELHESVRKAAKSGKIELNNDDAIKRLEDVTADCALSVRPHSAAETCQASAADNAKHPDPSAINEYYSSMGPPVITYYNPPSDYSHLYCLVPFPFQSHGFRFTGFFILKQFHRTIFVKQSVAFVSNRFHIFRNHKEFRIDPLARFNGKTFAGIGVSDGKRFIKTGISGSARKVFNSPQPWVRSHAGSEAGGRRR